MNLFQSYTSLVKSSGAGDKVFGLLDRLPAAPGTGSHAVTSSEEIEDDACQDPLVERVVQAAEERVASEPCGIMYRNSNTQSHCNIEINHVGFSYPTRPDNVVLHEFSLIVPQGKTVALVGASGRQQ